MKTYENAEYPELTKTVYGLNEIEKDTRRKENESLAYTKSGIFKEATSPR